MLPLRSELTTEEAADILNVSLSFVTQRIDAGLLPYRKVGTHRRIFRAELLEYKQKLDADCLRALEEMTRQAQELDMGY